MGIFKRKSVQKHASDRSFGIMLTIICLLMGVLKMGPELQFYSINFVWVLLSLLFFIISFVNPQIFAPFNSLWHSFGLLLRFISHPIILGLVFYGIITPLGFFMKVFKKDVLQLNLDKNLQTYWIYRDKKVCSTLKDQF